MIRNLRDIICLVAAVLLTGLAACSANDVAGHRTDSYLIAILDNFYQESFSPGDSSPENFMEHNTGTAVSLSAGGYDSPRCQTSVRAGAVQEPARPSVQAAAVHCQERIPGISRLADYYVFGLGHIII